jgi:putative N6-adenine-specific DNA methylase
LRKPTRLSLFAVCPPGLEPITRAELFGLGLNHPKAVPGGVEFSGFLNHIQRVNLWSRTASRVLVRLGEFEAKSFQELVRKTAGLPWETFLPLNTTVTVRATCHKSKLYHSDGVAERVVEAVNSRLEKHGQPGRKSAEPQTIIARLDHDHCTLSLDSSGAHLHQRGYRLDPSKAPLRETLAAALLLQAKYDPTQPLIDPFCGSGTFAIEAALMALNIPPGLQRSFAFKDWLDSDETSWNALIAQAQADRLPAAPAPILASDRDPGAVTATAENAERAGVRSSILITKSSVSAIHPPAGPGLLIANLPYGKRLGETDTVRNVYAQFGKVVREKCPDWRVGLLAGSPALAQQTRLALGEPLWIENGGLKVPFVISDRS